MVETRDKVLAMLLEGRIASEIARELSISKPAISKHISKLVEAGLWKRPVTEKAQAQPSLSPPPIQKSKRGGPLGNKKAVGARGNRFASAPRGNKNALKTGEHETIFADTLDDEELELYGGISTDTLRQAEEEVKLLTIRERRMLKRIANLQAAADRDGMTTVEITHEQGENSKGEIDVESRKRTGVLGQIQSIEEALTRVQERKRSALELLHKVRTGNGPGMPDINAYLLALNAKAGEVWAGEDPEDGEPE